MPVGYVEAVPEIVRLLIEQYGSASDAAKALGIAPSQLTRWGKGEQLPQVVTLQQVSALCPKCRPIIAGLFALEAATAG